MADIKKLDTELSPEDKDNAQKLGGIFGWAYMQGFNDAKEQILKHLIPEIEPEWEKFGSKLAERSKNFNS